MNWTMWKIPTRNLVLSIAVLCLAVVGLIIGAQMNSTSASSASATSATVASPAATFPGTGAGAIPDGGAACSPSPGANRDVTFAVAGLTGAPTSVSIDMTFGGPNHTWMGDVVAVLLAPNGASHTIFGRTLATTATSAGDNSDLGALYAFSDAAAAPPSGGWWQASAAQGALVAMPTGTYRTTASGGAGATNPMPPTNMNAAFTGVANPNGTWTLRLTDGCAADTGAISAANLTVNSATVANDATTDFNGDNRSDFVVVRNVGGGPNGQIRWFMSQAGNPNAITVWDWGLSSDFFEMEDFDGDNKDDICVWRPGAPTAAAFYILQSQTLTVRIDTFGQTGDNPDVVGDYDGDGKADVAVYREGVNSGDPSTWFYRGSLTPGAVNYVPWGQNGDFPAPGDYDGDLKYDFVVQRNAGGGQAAFWRRLATGAQSVQIYGTPSDVIVPNDYDGDGKTDIAVTRGSAGQINWYIDFSGTPAIETSPIVFGASATDFVTHGDYDGDGRAEPAVWRPSATPGQSAFWFYNYGSTSGASFPWGQNGDYPVANFRAF